METSPKDTRQPSVGALRTPNPTLKKFRFLKTWIYSTFGLSLILGLFFGFVGSFEDEFLEPLIGVVVLAAILAILLTFIIKWRSVGLRLEKRTETVLSQDDATRYKGLDGYLGLVILNLLAVSFLEIKSIYDNVLLFTNGTVGILSDPSSEIYISSYSGLLKFELMASIISSMLTIYLIYLFFKKSKKFPRYFIVFLVAAAIYGGIDYAALSLATVSTEAKKIIDEILSEQGTQVARAFFALLIWGSYMEKSKRVKATFTN